MLSYLSIYLLCCVCVCALVRCSSLKWQKAFWFSFKSFHKVCGFPVFLMEDSSYVCKYTQADFIFSIVENINFPET